MSFASVLFLILFLPATLLAYWLVPRRATAQNLVLLAASYLFYASWGPKALLLFGLTTLVNYGLFLCLRDKNEDGTPRHGGKVMFAGLVYNLGQLLLLKYWGFFTTTVAHIGSLVGAEGGLPVLSLLLPIGISFWTLQLVAYLIDVSYGRRPAPRSLLDFATFVAFFPQIVSGPIARGDLLDQMEQARQPSVAQFSRGAFEFLLGYTMKFLVAATLSDLVDPVYAASDDYGAGAHWLALYAYAGQIFCDFAGYSLLALGIARGFGLNLIENFRFPFLARNISDFWKRWHISLTNILFDYIYTPLVTGNGFMRGRLALGLFVVLVVSGLWHGATWMFVLWGALHGAVLAIAHRWDEFYRGLCRKDRSWVARRKSRAYVVTAWALTVSWFLFSLIPFRSPDLAVAGRFFAGLFGAGGDASVGFGSISSSFNFLLCLAFVPVYHLSATETGKRVATALFTTPPPLRGVGYGMIVVYLFLFMPLADGTFVYARF